MHDPPNLTFDQVEDLEDREHRGEILTDSEARTLNEWRATMRPTTKRIVVAFTPVQQRIKPITGSGEQD